MIIAWTFLHGLALTMLWRWYLVPAGLPPFGMPYGILVASITALFASRTPRRPIHLLPPLAALLIGYLFH